MFDYLEGLITHPAATYLTLAEITEKEEEERINKEIGNRRSRLTATQGNVVLEVKHEVLSTSRVSCKLAQSSCRSFLTIRLIARRTIPEYYRLVG